MTSTSTSSRTRRASPRGTRLALCLAFVIALAAAQPAEAFKWKWWKWNAIASHGHHGGHHGGSPKGDSVKHSGGHMKSSSWSGDDSECDDCGTWWRAKQWQQDSWWGKHSRRQDRDGWKPDTGLRAAKCMLHQCGWELKKCRFDMTCRESMQCAIGTFARENSPDPNATHPLFPRSLGPAIPPAFLVSRFARSLFSGDSTTQMSDIQQLKECGCLGSIKKVFVLFLFTS